MDEVFGFFPPTANPPSKLPMLTLLKQARAFGLGCVLSTQNPVDLDYKGLSNCGTWFLGRLQTERDKARVLDGLESVAGAGREGFDRATLERTLSSLDKRVFLMNDVHEDAPVLMRTRWTLSYLAGPLSRPQIKRLTAERAAPAAASGAAGPVATAPRGGSAQATPQAPAQTAAPRPRPVLPAEADEAFLPITRAPTAAGALAYRPALLGVASVHHVNAKAGVDRWSKCVLLAPLAGTLEGSPWNGARVLSAIPDLERAPDPRAGFAALPAVLERKTTWAALSKQLLATVQRDHPLLLLRCADPALVSGVGEDEGAFRGRIADQVRAERDRAIEALRKKLAPKLAVLADRVARANERVARETAQYESRRNEAALSLGASVLGALFGRKLASAGNVSRAATTIRGAGRAAQERADIGRAEERVEDVERQRAELEAELERGLAAIRTAAEGHAPALETLRVEARKGDLAVERVALVWIPEQAGEDGRAELLCADPFPAAGAGRAATAAVA